MNLKPILVAIAIAFSASAIAQAPATTPASPAKGAAKADREAVKADPENLTARWNLGTALEALGDPVGAFNEYEAVLIRYARIGRPSEPLQAAAQRLRIKLQGTTQTPLPVAPASRR